METRTRTVLADSESSKPRRRGGRPRLSQVEPSTSVSLKLLVSTYERVCALAAERRMTTPDLMRLVIARALRDTKEI